MHASPTPAADTAPDMPPLDCNCFALRSAARHVTQLYDAALAPLGLRATQFSILARLAASGPWSINALAERLVMDRTTLGRNIQPLAREALLAIGPDAADRRSRALTITPDGAARVVAARLAWADAQSRFEHAYGAERAIALRAALKLVTDTRF